ncbi:MAG: hypothetical protein JO214_17895 [Frankiaceae bacterium]|nr:hypothetical protein [Frankiaceae bacterium]
MTTLAADIDETQTLIPVDAGLENERDVYPLFCTIDAESVRVVGRAIETTWLVERGVAGTTPAAHSSGATLTRYYPDAPGGGDGIANPMTAPLVTGGQSIQGADDPSRGGASLQLDAGADDGTAALMGGNGDTGIAGGALLLQGGNGDAGNDAGARVILDGGDGEGNPGAVRMTAAALRLNDVDVTFGISAAADPEDIADPGTATAEDVATKLNDLMAAMRAAGQVGGFG